MYRSVCFSATVLALLVVLPAPSLAADPVTAAGEAESYELTLAAMKKVETAYRSLADAVKSDPGLRQRMEAMSAREPAGDGSLPSLDAAVRQWDAIPEFARAAKSAGVEPREMVLFSYVLAGTAMASAMSQGRELPASPPALARNVQWYRENETAVTSFLQRMDEIFPDGEADEDSPGGESVEEPEDGEGTEAFEETSAGSDSTGAAGQ
jgi:hypothetical protein